MKPLILEVIIVGSFLAGVGASFICQAILRAAWTAPFLYAEPEAVSPGGPSFLTSGSRDEPPTTEPVPALEVRLAAPRFVGTSARHRFATPLPVAACSPAEWARRAFDDPRAVRLAVQIGAGA